MNPSEILPIYNETLFVINANDKKNSKKIGNFERKVLAVVNDDDWNDENEIFLRKILGSCNLNNNDYLIVIKSSDENIFEIINHHTPEILFLFSVNLDSEFFKTNRNLYKPFTFNKIKTVMTDTLKVLNSDKEKRLLLWNGAIKVLFNIQ